VGVVECGGQFKRMASFDKLVDVVDNGFQIVGRLNELAGALQ